MTTIDDQKLADLEEISKLIEILTIEAEAYAKKYKIKESTKTTLARKYLKVCDFIRNLIKELSDDDFIFDKEEKLLLTETGEPIYKSEVVCLLTKIKCEKLLKEIGEI